MKYEFTGEDFWYIELALEDRISRLQQDKETYSNNYVQRYLSEAIDDCYAVWNKVVKYHKTIPGEFINEIQEEIDDES